MRIELYRLNVLTGTFSRIKEVSSYTGLSYTGVLNGVGQCSFTLNALNPVLTKSNFIPYNTHIVLRDDDESIAFFGPYSYFEADISGVAGSVNIQAYSFFHHLFYRNTDKNTSYVQVEQSQILRNLVNLTQGRDNGLLGITLNSEDTGIIRDRTYEYKNIGEAFLQMSQVDDGMDFDFVPVLDGAGLLNNVNLQFYNLKKGSVRNDLQSLKLGQLGNVLSFGAGTNGDLYNALISEGAGFQDAILSVVENASLQQSYTRREIFYPQKDVSTQDTLDQNSLSYFNQVSTPKIRTNAQLDSSKNPRIDQFTLGDYLNINIDIRDIKASAGDLVQFVGSARIVELKINVDDQGIKTVVPKFIYRN